MVCLILPQVLIWSRLDARHASMSAFKSPSPNLFTSLRSDVLCGALRRGEIRPSYTVLAAAAPARRNKPIESAIGQEKLSLACLGKIGIYGVVVVENEEPQCLF